MADRMEPVDSGPGPWQAGKTAMRFRLGQAVRLRPRAKGAARQRAVAVMLGQNRALVAEEIARAILESQPAAGRPAESGPARSRRAGPDRRGDGTPDRQAQMST